MLGKVIVKPMLQDLPCTPYADLVIVISVALGPGKLLFLPGGCSSNRALRGRHYSRQEEMILSKFIRIPTVGRLLATNGQAARLSLRSPPFPFPPLARRRLALTRSPADCLHVPPISSGESSRRVTRAWLY